MTTKRKKTEAKTEKEVQPNLKLKRSQQRTENLEEEPEPPAVSAGPIDKVIELAFNPSREKIREVTIIDRMQGRLFPLLDMVNCGVDYILAVASYRESGADYRREYGAGVPEQPNLLDELMYRTAQWQKSVQGKNLDRATDIALAETETRADEGDSAGSGRKDPWGDD